MKAQTKKALVVWAVSLIIVAAFAHYCHAAEPQAQAPTREQLVAAANDVNGQYKAYAAVADSVNRQREQLAVQMAEINKQIQALDQAAKDKAASEALAKRLEGEKKAPKK